MEYELDFTEITDARSLQKEFMRAIPVPDHYGRNFDALFDVLTSLPGDTTIWVSMAGDVLNDPCIPRCIKTFSKVCEDATRENPGLTVAFVSDDPEDLPEDDRSRMLHQKS